MSKEIIDVDFEEHIKNYKALDMVKNLITYIECFPPDETHNENGSFISKRYLKIILKELQRLDKYKQALETIINKFIWLEPNGEIRVGRFGDVEIPLEDDDFESSREIDNLKEVLKNE